MSVRGLSADRPLRGVLRLRLDRPQRRNALDGALVEALHAAFELDRPLAERPHP